MTGADWLRLAGIPACIALIFPRVTRLPWRSYRMVSYTVSWGAAFGPCYLLWEVAGDRGNCRLPVSLSRVVNPGPDCPPPGQ